MKFLCFCLPADENIMCREQLRTASGTATLWSCRWDAPVGASRPEFCSAPSTDSLRNFCSSQSDLSSSGSPFCRSAPGDNCPLFVKDVEIYRWKILQKYEVLLIKVPTSLKVCNRESSRKMHLGRQTGWALQELSLGLVKGLCLECMFVNHLDQEWFCELGYKVWSMWNVK